MPQFGDQCRKQVTASLQSQVMLHLQRRMCKHGASCRTPWHAAAGSSWTWIIQLSRLISTKCLLGVSQTITHCLPLDKVEGIPF